MQITPIQIEQFKNDGFFILESVIPTATIEALRTECHLYIGKFEREMEAKGVTTDGINHYKRRYFIANRYRESTIIADFLFGDLMAQLTQAVLGDNVYLFHEQYVVKAADSEKSKFSWHQDSGYVGYYHRPYLSCWCALDDMSAANGTISVLPYGRANMQPDDLFDHTRATGSNDMVGYKGDDPGDLAIVPVGSIVVFSSRTLHKSGPNHTDQMRRSYLAQYSAEPIMTQDGTAIKNQAVPLWVNGQRAEKITQSTD